MNSNITVPTTLFSKTDPESDANTDVQSSNITHHRSWKRIWISRILTGIAGSFLALDAAMKSLALRPAVEGTTQLGHSANTLPGVGLVQLICLALYLIPRIAPIGAVPLTGYLGGAVATHVRIGNPLFTHVLFPVYVATFLWVGLWLRDPWADALLAPSSPGDSVRRGQNE